MGLSIRLQDRSGISYERYKTECRNICTYQCILDTREMEEKKGRSLWRKRYSARGVFSSLARFWPCTSWHWVTLEVDGVLRVA